MTCQSNPGQTALSVPPLVSCTLAPGILLVMHKVKRSSSQCQPTSTHGCGHGSSSTRGCGRGSASNRGRSHEEPRSLPTPPWRFWDHQSHSTVALVKSYLFMWTASRPSSTQKWRRSPSRLVVPPHHLLVSLRHLLHHLLVPPPHPPTKLRLAASSHSLVSSL